MVDSLGGPPSSLQMAAFLCPHRGSREHTPGSAVPSCEGSTPTTWAHLPKALLQAPTRGDQGFHAGILRDTDVKSITCQKNIRFGMELCPYFILGTLVSCQLGPWGNSCQMELDVQEKSWSLLLARRGPPQSPLLAGWGPPRSLPLAGRGPWTGDGWLESIHSVVPRKSVQPNWDLGPERPAEGPSHSHAPDVCSVAPQDSLLGALPLKCPKSNPFSPSKPSWPL